MSKKPKKPIPKSGSRKTAKPSKVSDLSMDSYHETESALLDKIQTLESELSDLNASHDILKGREDEANQFIQERDNIKARHKEIISSLNKEIDEGIEREIAVEKDAEETKLANKTAEHKLSLVKAHRRIRNGIIAVLTLSVLGTSYLFYKDNTAKKAEIAAKDANIETISAQVIERDTQISTLSEKLRPAQAYIDDIAARDKEISDLKSENAKLDAENSRLIRQVDSVNKVNERAELARRSAVQRASELIRVKNGDVPDTIYTYNELRLTFLNYIEKGLGEKYSLSPKYVSCLRGKIIDELDDVYGSFGAWERLKDQSKKHIERCQRELNVSWDKKEAVTDYILREYMYKDGNFLQTAQQNYRRDLSKK